MSATRGGARITVSGGKQSSITLGIRDEDSLLLRLFGASGPEPEAVTLLSLVFLALMLPACQAAQPAPSCHWPRCSLPGGSCDEGRNCVN